MTNINYNELSQRAKESLQNVALQDANNPFIVRKTWVDVATANTTGVSGATIIPTFASNPTTYSFNTPIDFARLITVKGSASAMAEPVVIGGYDIMGNSITSTVTLVGNTTVETTKAYNRVTGISLPTQVTAGSVVVGTSAKLGLGILAADNAAILGLVDDVRESTFPVITGGSDITKNVVSFNTAPNGSRDLTLYYIGQSLIS